MKSSVIISCIFLLCFFVCSCQPERKQTNKDEAFVINLNEKEPVKKINLSQFLSHEKYIALETTPDCLIGAIQKIEIYKNRIFILDPYIAKKLLVFDKTGKFLHAISERGKGPGEYWDIFDFIVQDNKIFILNNRSSVNEYTLDGTFSSTYSLPLWTNKFFNIGNNGWGLITNSDKSNGYDFNFHIVSKEFNKERGYLKNKFDNFPITPIQQVSSLNDTSFFFLPLDNKIYSANNKGVFEKYNLQYPNDCILSESELSNYIKLPIRERVEKILNNSISLSSIIFTDKLKMIRYSQKRNPFWCFIVNDMEYISVSEDKIINDIDSVPFLPTFYSTFDGNKIVSSFKNYNLNEEMNTSNLNISKELKKILSESKENSNPILAIFSTDGGFK